MAGWASAGRPLSDPDAGLFGPDSVTWRIDREAFLLLGAGPRALLMQVAHPAIAAGVDRHSNFRDDPWRRLSGTLRSYLRIVYGTTGVARAEIRRLNSLHRGIRGHLPDGRSYDARDPDLALWVHATLVDSAIATGSAWLEPLDHAARARAYAESVPVGRAFGIPEGKLPANVDAFDAYVAGMISDRGPVAVGPLARELADAVLHPPLSPAIRTMTGPLAGVVPSGLLDAVVRAGGGVPSAAIGWLFWPAIGLLPEPVRDGYGFRWGTRERVVSSWLVSAWRAWAAVLPRGFRQMARATAADRRMASNIEP
ncbi:MAG: oxygenase MpaB family protein [Candidatus Limnocylindrales bacterium]